MTFQHARGILRDLLARRARDDFDVAEQFAQSLQRDRTGAKETGATGDGKVEDRGFDAVGAGAADAAGVTPYTPTKALVADDMSSSSKPAAMAAPPLAISASSASLTWGAGRFSFVRFRA